MEDPRSLCAQVAEVVDVGEGGWMCSWHWSSDPGKQVAEMKRDLLRRLVEHEMQAHRIKTLLFRPEFQGIFPAP